MRYQARQHRIALDHVTSREIRGRETHIAKTSDGQLMNHFERFVGSSLQNEDVRDVLSPEPSFRTQLQRSLQLDQCFVEMTGHHEHRTQIAALGRGEGIVGGQASLQVDGILAAPFER